MAVSSSASGTQAATISTEHTLTTKTVAGVYVLVVDTTNMVGGDELELRIYTKNQSGKGSVLAQYALINNVQGIPQFYSNPLPIDTEWKATLKQIQGTGRNFDWNALVM